VGLDVTSQGKLREKDLDQLRLATDPIGQFVIRLLDLAEEETHEAHPTLYDPLAIAVIFRPDLVDFQPGTVNIPLSGGGQAIFQPEAASKIKVGSKVNSTAFLDLFTERMSRGSGGLR